MNIQTSYKNIFAAVMFFVFSFFFFSLGSVSAQTGGPEVVWSNASDVTETSPGVFTIIGHLEVSGISPNGPVVSLIVFSDSDADFNPPEEVANQGPVLQNGEINFTYGGSSANTAFLAVLVSDTYNGLSPFLPFSQQPFIVSVGQVASPDGSAGGGNPSGGGSTGGGNPNTGGSGGGGTSGGGSTGGQGGAGSGGTNTDGAEANTGSVTGWPADVIDNPLAVSSTYDFIVGLLNALLKIGIPIMVIFLVYSGLRLVMARGNEKELADAKKNLLWVIIGVAILLSAWTIVKVLKGTLDQIEISLITNLINYFV